MENTNYDFIIVGAGIAGLYAAYKIVKNDPQKKILILEQSKRTGGRLDSDLLEIDNKKYLIKEEEGGMRFTFEDMPHLMNLIVELGLDKYIVPFPMHLDNNNRLFFRGVSFNHNESEGNKYNIWENLYRLKNNEKGKNPFELIPNCVYKKIIENDDNKSHRDFFEKIKEKHQNNLKVENSGEGEFEDKFEGIEISAPGIWQYFRLNFKWKGIKLCDWTLWSLLADMEYSNECIQMMARISGFNGTYFSTMNAGEAFQLLMEFPSEPDFKSLRYGFSQLTNALIDELNKYNKVKIALNCKANSISPMSKIQNYIKLKLKLKLQIQLQKDKDIEIYNLKTENLILSIPRLSIERLFNASNLGNFNSQIPDTEIWKKIESTSNQPLLKINIYYNHAWWASSNTTNTDVTFGANLTDLPLGSVYPFYTDTPELTVILRKLQDSIVEHRLGKYTENEINCLKEKFKSIMKDVYKKPAALTIYCDYQNINFWQGYAKNLSKENRYPHDIRVKQVTNLKENGDIESQSISDEWITPASSQMVEIIQKYFKTLFQSSNIPNPIATSVRIWEGSQSLKTDAYGEYGYGVHQWGVGAKDNEVIEFMIKPFDDFNIYSCGESYSDFQGWVEGALRSTNLVLNKLNIKTDIFKEKNYKNEKELLRYIRDIYKSNFK